jgi:hypothetical protein
LPAEEFPNLYPARPEIKGRELEMKRAKKANPSKQKRIGKRDLIVTETRRITTEPKVEIRKAATLAQALTEPQVAVVKPETKARVVRRTTRRAA